MENSNNHEEEFSKVENLLLTTYSFIKEDDVQMVYFIDLENEMHPR